MRKVMSEDLISRNALLEELKSFSMNITGLNNSTYRFVTDQCKKSIMRIVDEQPTAYDVDKVVKRLEPHKACYEKKTAEYDERGDAQNRDISDAISLAYGKAIEIVKAGGVNE